ncbi:hypothetical protein [Nitrosomonas sp. PY1]|uniref:hypothetical protein n=1 Tax=Nitrosomonas sp. PY1 TaxID=1803906 RepID=UPI001FC88B8A|nr:hypothetical protein [Nitrosomonas sp. PY1]
MLSQMDEKRLASFLHHLTIARNHCAHHGRIWDRKMTVKMKLPKNPKNLASALNESKDVHGKLYNTLVMLNFLLSIVSPASQWRGKLITLLEESSVHASTASMGFPNEWKSLPFWAKS